MIPIIWKEYTATVSGSVYKLARCESCSTEYVYRMERSASGMGTSFYLLDNQGAANRAALRAEQVVALALEHDFDPVPCPACGYYQPYMIPRIRQLKWPWLRYILLALLILSVPVLLYSIYCTVMYVDRDTDANFNDMAIAWGSLGLLGLLAFGMITIKRRRFRNLDPNREDKSARIAVGQRLAVTRAEFDRTRKQGGKGAAERIGDIRICNR